MENCTIYSHQLKFDSILKILKECIPEGEIELTDRDIHKTITINVKGGFLSKNKKLEINYREREVPSYKLEEITCDLTQNLAGMTNFVQSLPAQNETINNKFLYKIMSANCEMSFIARPKMNEAFQLALKRITKELDAFVFAQPSISFNKSKEQHFLDKDLNLIVDMNGKCDIEDIEVNVNPKYHDQPAVDYNEEQIKRRKDSNAYLQSNGVKVNENLPCTVSFEETELREIKEIINRVYALMVIAAKGEGVPQEQLQKVIEIKNISSFSPKERSLLETPQLQDHDRAYATWRYESLYALLWALGVLDELKYPSEICNVEQVLEPIFKPTREEFEASLSLRYKEEILKELDKTYRMNWACVDARINGEQPSGSIHAGIVYERHYALNWLTNYQNQAWDDVQTNT